MISDYQKFIYFQLFKLQTFHLFLITNIFGLYWQITFYFSYFSLLFHLLFFIKKIIRLANSLGSVEVNFASASRRWLTNTRPVAADQNRVGAHLYSICNKKKK